VAILFPAAVSCRPKSGPVRHGLQDFAHQEEEPTLRIRLPAFAEQERPRGSGRRKVLCRMYDLQPGLLDDPVDLGLAGKVGKVELAAADRFCIGQR